MNSRQDRLVVQGSFSNPTGPSASKICQSIQLKSWCLVWPERMGESAHPCSFQRVNVHIPHATSSFCTTLGHGQMADTARGAYISTQDGAQSHTRPRRRPSDSPRACPDLEVQTNGCLTLHTSTHWTRPYGQGCNQRSTRPDTKTLRP